DRAVLARGLHRFLRDRGSGGREAREDAAGVEPARAVLAEDALPVDLAGLELARRAVRAIGAAERAADAEAALGEVEAVADAAADAVVGDPANVRLIDAALVEAVLDQPSDGIVGERRHHGGVEPEAALEA